MENRCFLCGRLICSILFTQLFLLLIGFFGTSLNAQEHPFLLVKKSDYESLIAKSSKEPWSTMKSSVITKFNTLSVTSDPDRVRAICAHGALAYILHPQYRTNYAAKIADALKKWDVIYAQRPEIKLGVTNHNWIVTRVGNAFFNSVLALDIIHDELSPGDLSEIEHKLANMAEYYYQIKYDPDVKESEGWDCWSLNRYGCAGIWEIYKGTNRTRIEEIKADYYNKLQRLITDDGTWSDGTGYAAARLAHKRDAKSHFMDVVEFTGEGNYYNDPMMISFYEWLFGYVPTPFKYTNPFGDSAPKSVAFHYGSPTYRAGRFSDLAAGYASWARWPTSNPEPTLLFYLSIDDEIAEPIAPVSRIFPTGGAWFMEENLDQNSVSVVMWNPNEGEDYGHAHYEINALNICAFGEIVMQNAGYNNADKGWKNYSWDYIHHTAEAGNTIQIDEKNHFSRTGGGIIDGFVSEKFDYASGLSAQAINNGQHIRNLVFVHPEGNYPGYILTFDEVTPNDPSHKVYAAWHPHADNATELNTNEEYEFAIHPKTFEPNKDIKLNIFLATEPNNVQIKNGAICMYAESFEGKYLYPEYSVDASGESRFLTIFSPHDFTHPKPSVTRVCNSAYSGAVMNLGGSVTDVALESDGSEIVIFGNISFQGKAGVFRSGNHDSNFYFVRKGNYYNDGEEMRTGFSSDEDISIHVRKNKGKINTGTEGANVTFYSPGINSIKIDGEQAVIIDAEEDLWVTVFVPGGEHELEFINSTTKY